MPPRPPYSSAMSADSSKTGQPWVACQSRLGSHITSATRPPSHSHGDRSWCAGRAGQRDARRRTPSSATATSCLALRPSPAIDPGQQPEARPLVAQRVPGDQRDRRPRHHVEGLRGQPVSDGDHHRPRCRCRPRRAPVHVVPPPTQAGGQRRQHDEQAHGQQAGQPQQHQVVPVDLVGEPGQQRDERRLVGVAPRQPVTRGGEVELVAVRSVERRHHQQHRAERRLPPGPPGRGRAEGGRSRMQCGKRVTCRTTSASILRTSRSQVSSPLSSSSTSLSWV